jgi:hypothetical protein
MYLHINFYQNSDRVKTIIQLKSLQLIRPKVFWFKEKMNFYLVSLCILAFAKPGKLLLILKLINQLKT